MRRPTGVAVLPGVVVLAGLVVVAAAFPLALRAQADDGPQFLTAVPESPAFTFLGVAPDLVSRPGSVRELGASLLSGIGADGRAQQGVALDVTPWFYVPNLSIPLSEYSSNVLLRSIANSQISLGTVRSAGDSASTDLALGFRTVPWDGTDAMQNDSFTTAIARDLRGCVRQVPPGLSEEEGRQRLQACADSTMAGAWDRWEEYSERNWNAGFLALGAGVGARLAESRIDDVEYGGAKLWTVAGVGIGDASQVIGQVTYADGLESDAGDGYSEFTYGARLVLGAPRFNAFGELVGVARSSLPDDDGTGLHWSAGVEFRLLDQGWVSTGFGQRYQGLGQPDRAVVLVGMRLGLSNDRRMTGGLRAPRP